MVPISGGNELIDPHFVLKKAGVEPGFRVADLGCGGAGHFIIPAGHVVGKQGQVYAVDILKTVLHTVASRARSEGLTNLKTVWSNLEIPGATRIKAGSLDVALIINMLFQTKHDEAVLAEGVRLLKTNGTLLVIDWKKNGMQFGPSATDRIDASRVIEIVQGLGLKLTERFDAGQYHFGLVFKK